MSSTDASNLFGVQGIIAVVTGGGTGIGLMMTKGLIDHGAAKVYIIGRRKEKLVEAAAYCPKRIEPIVGDVTSKESLINAGEIIKQQSGHVNLLVCNSGMASSQVGVDPFKTSVADFAKKALEQDVGEWQNVLTTNVSSVFFTTMAFLELLDAGNRAGNAPGRSSQVLVTSSIAGYLRMPHMLGVYQCSKAAATHLVKHLASALSPYAIRVNGLAPGLFPSDLAGPTIAFITNNAADPTADNVMASSLIPARRLGRETDMVGTVIYLASAAAAYINGNITVIDGGRIGLCPSTY